ncbi:MAG: ABC transporter permease [Cyclobacteriaceae bacterium]
MFKNYLKTALRNLLRDKGRSFLNIAGLTLGIGSCLVLVLLLRYHTSFDHYHSKADRIYRIVMQSDGNQGKSYTSGVPAVLPEAVRNDFTEAETVTFVSYRNGGLVTIHGQGGEPRRYDEERGISYVQPSFFAVFDRKVLQGDASQGLDEPNEAVISRSLAIKYFGKEEAIGEVLNYDHHDFKITAIIEDAPTNTDVPINLMLSDATVRKELDEHGWHSIWSDEQCFIVLKPGEKIETLEANVPAFIKKYYGEQEGNRDNRTLIFQPLADMHFDERFSNFNYNVISRETLLALSVIALFLILTASINFINLSTAEAVKRSKEVGIRKAMGSTRGQLVLQFLGEATLVTAVSALIALAIAQGSLASINAYLHLSLRLSLTDPVMLVLLTSIVVIVSVLSGLYPAFVVSGFQPISALKNKLSGSNSSGFGLRRGLVVLQFFISQFLVIATLVLITQMSYFSHQDLGFRKEAILTIPIPEPAQASGDTLHKTLLKTLREEVHQTPGVEAVSLNSNPPSSGSVSATSFNMGNDDKFYEAQVKLVDGNYLELFGLQLVAGKNILDLDTAQGFIVNEKLAELTGHQNPGDIVGKIIHLWGKKLPVVGVVRNFNTVSLHDPIEATVLFNRLRNYHTLSVKIDMTHSQDVVKAIQAKWEAAFPEYIFSYEYLDDNIREFYDAESRNTTLLSVFTGLAIFIGCLGLFGLASFMANQKTKEIGVRKVLGASVESILFIFSREFVVLILVGFVLAAPVAWMVMNQWLNNFAYHIEIGPGIFLLSGGVTLLIALLTVGYRSWRAATVNPVESLKCE